MVFGGFDISNWFGLTNGKFFGEPPAYVDKTKLPGMSEIPTATFLGWLTNTPFVLINSPNFVWASMSLVLYNFAPYDLSPSSSAALSPISYNFLNERLRLWIPTVIGYFGFWHTTLHFLNYSSRPFIANRNYNIQKVVHNMFWTLSGVCIWTLYENVFCYLWASGRLPYISDAITFSGTTNGNLYLLAALMGVPVWRSVHFYFAHRFLHFGPLYQQVHSLHHRNTDIEPFSGLCMHPIEHLYYYACVAPSLVFYCSPYAFFWNGLHLLFSPAAGHSGYEDHFQSDAFHYMHHRYFECNYAGGDAGFMDVLFGTFRSSMQGDGDSDGPKPREDAKSTLLTIPTFEFVVYLTLSLACFGVTANYIHSDLTKLQIAGFSALTGFGPTFLAVFISRLFGKGQLMKQTSMTSTGYAIHILGGSILCALPVSYATWLTLQS